jgi:hypothetical protein
MLLLMFFNCIIGSVNASESNRYCYSNLIEILMICSNSPVTQLFMNSGRFAVVCEV